MRRWRESDCLVLAEMSSDPVVMEHFPRLSTFDECQKMVEVIETEFDERGFSFWALERKDRGDLIGFTGLHQVPFEAPFTPAVEIGWRLRQNGWGQGFATEAARRALQFGFEAKGLDEIVSLTISANARSQAVMQRVGMTHQPEDDFDHPKLRDDLRTCRHLLYRLSREDWFSNRSA